MAQRATQSVMVAATPSRVYSVVVDFGRYREWVADLKEIDVVERDADGRALEVAFRAAAFGRSTRYTLRYDYSRAPELLSWHQTRGDVAESLNGSYRFDPVPAGTPESTGAPESTGDPATTVTYDLEVTLAVPVPQFIQGRAAGRIQRHALSELKRRVERLP
ncbi:MAG: SRPBCC family protein [Acidobacteriota bacterium]|nr:SRPBCC family protein [Acidobacteriota bacterium]